MSLYWLNESVIFQVISYFTPAYKHLMHFIIIKTQKTVKPVHILTHCQESCNFHVHGII